MTIQLPLRHLALGLGALAALFVLFSFAQQPAPAAVENGLRVQYMPHPSQMLQIKEGTPYTVPDGAIFVLTALGTTDGNGYGSLDVDGVQEARAFQTGNGGQDTTSVRPVAMGFTASAGSVLSVQNGVGKGRAWGYLVRQ